MLVSRRQLLNILSLGLFQSAFGMPVVFAGYLQPILTAIKFEHFHQLSSFLTKSADLGVDVSQKIYRLIMEEPAGPEHLLSVYQKIQDAISYTGGHVRIADIDFPSHEKWFISHLLLTWYTGIYFHERGNQHVTLDNALMYKRLSYRKAPTYCGGLPGFWVSHPENNA